jgi:RimJ/RimL family protein N-acetyltransferase
MDEVLFWGWFAVDRVEIRRARQGDEHQMAVFMGAMCAEAPDTVTRRPAPTPDDQRQFLEQAEGAERAFVLLALDGEEVVGLLDLWAGGKPETRHAASFGMCVAAERRNQGVGRRLLQAAIQQALLWEGFRRIELEVAAWNGPAIRLYEQLGFGHEGRKVKAVNIRGEPEDTLIMARTW